MYQSRCTQRTRDHINDEGDRTARICRPHDQHDSRSGNNGRDALMLLEPFCWSNLIFFPPLAHPVSLLISPFRARCQPSLPRCRWRTAARPLRQLPPPRRPAPLRVCAPPSCRCTIRTPRWPLAHTINSNQLSARMARRLIRFDLYDTCVCVCVCVLGQCVVIVQPPSVSCQSCLSVVTAAAGGRGRRVQTSVAYRGGGGAARLRVARGRRGGGGGGRQRAAHRNRRPVRQTATGRPAILLAGRGGRRRTRR